MSSSMHLLYKNFQLVDGTSAPAVQGDLRVVDGVIAEVGGSLAAHGAQCVQGDGLMVLSPGFIDVHTHDDAQVLLSPHMKAKLSQGVTTVIVGNCGISLVPLVTAKPVAPLNLLDSGCFRFPTLTDYAHAVNEAQPAVNVAALVGHTALRLAVMDEYDRPANAREIGQMQTLLRDAMAHGAMGLSSGVFYQPAAAADVQELLPLCRVVAQHAGVYVTHIRTEFEDILSAMKEAAETADSAKVPLIYSHHKCAGPRNWGRAIETLAYIDRLSRAQPVGLDVYPYTAGSTILREDLVDDEIDILITRSEPHPEVVGEYLADIAQRWGLSSLACARRLMPGGACYFQVSEDDLRRVLAHPMSMIGSDGLPHDQKPHPRLWGSFPRVLGHYSRDLGLLSLETAVHKMSGLSARRFGLRGRGVLKQGAVADLVVFHPDRVRDCATYASPALPSQGIEQVYLAGQLAWNEGEIVGRHGRFLPRTQQESVA